MIDFAGAPSNFRGVVTAYIPAVSGNTAATDNSRTAARNSLVKHFPKATIIVIDTAHDTQAHVAFQDVNYGGLAA